MKKILLLLFAFAAAMHAAERPNIIFILCDDLGYGDVRCFNAEGKIATPNFDRLAAGGIRFTDAHTSSAVCTPTRYGLLTGRYNWRSRLQSGVLGGLSPALIEPGRLTVAALLRDHGYRTACMGKWHLGMNWPRKVNAADSSDSIEEGAAGWQVDYAKPIARGPLSVGFDTFFGISASLDMVPYTFIQDDHVAVVPTVDNAFPMMLGRPGHETRRGPAAKDFEAMDVLPTLARKACEYVEARGAEAKAARAEAAPFFLYLPLNAPHTPIAPTPEWQGKSGLNPYADFVMETDWAIGQVLDALDRSGLAADTLVFATSDNGCSPEAKFAELAAKGHNPGGPLRGAKADIWDGGHRVPFIARWPGRIKAGATSRQIICLNDFMATCAEIIGAKLPDNAGEDSVSLLPALLGRDDAPLHEAVVHHSINGSFSIRQENWKLELCRGSGGWSDPKPGSPAERALPPAQLYDLSADIAEQRNVATQYPEVVERLAKLLEKYVANGRSTPGVPQKNAVPIVLWKGRAKAGSGSAD
jgi:arylsulfatase A-like enzyme